MTAVTNTVTAIGVVTKGVPDRPLLPRVAAVPQLRCLVTAAGWLAFALTVAVLVADARGAAPRAAQVGVVDAAAPGRGSAVGGVADIQVSWLPDTVRRWSYLIVPASQANGVDPAFVAIIVLVESGGNPNAVSSSGAMGLMQIMPSTAADVAARRGLADYSRERLLDPAFNIDMGTWYVAEMLRTFGSADDPDWQQSVELAAAAYNGGPGAVRGWLEANGTLPSESARYRQWVGAMWSERAHAASSGFETWMAAGGSRLVEAARGQA